MEGKAYSLRHRTSAKNTRKARVTAIYPCFASSENAHTEAKASIATITPRFMPFDLHLDPLSIGPLNGKLMNFDLFGVGSFGMALSDEARLI